jgi:hypothetical protein
VPLPSIRYAKDCDKLRPRSCRQLTKCGWVVHEKKKSTKCSPFTVSAESGHIARQNWHHWMPICVKLTRSRDSRHIGFAWGTPWMPWAACGLREPFAAVYTTCYEWSVTLMHHCHCSRYMNSPPMVTTSLDQLKDFVQQTFFSTFFFGKVMKKKEKRNK